ncbi:hypothetical protein BAUCODRAFT_126776 [Baudoinia panamericana UAMH 10762]|uniref:Uncharacterized protein n=1 Tax=Baudoinia panamericana (strain UAMH 10762) TaxID=717646 RepID=M2MZM3_BAUPA|nr:uncharacterized protein BAUCODRAFT_126776 [Baudoinia panamericana UAMH 10762]EMC91790.1 hypothetical protein BAUCODRAFT_126776 [Baudoinia panamericana UAMH 10762]
MYPNRQPSVLPALYFQHRFYTSQLTQTHQALSKSYRKLARVETELADGQDRQVTRKEKKQLQWSKSTTRATVQKLESQQANLQESLRQCNHLIASYGTNTSCYQWPLPPETPWTTHPPTTSWTGSQICSPYGPFTPTPWHGWLKTATAPVHSRTFTVTSQQQPPRPQYWDLSMLRERRQSSPEASLADSGFYEPATNTQLLAAALASEDRIADPEHVFAHELIEAAGYKAAEAASEDSSMGGHRSMMSSVSEKDEVPELPRSPIVSALSGVELNDESKATWLLHQRRHSENAVSLIESCLAVPRKHVRGASIGPVPAQRRKRDTSTIED